MVRLSEAEQAMLRKSFHLLDQITTFYQSAYRGYPNTGNFVYTSAVSQNNNQFWVSANQPECTSTSHFVPHVTTAGDNANAAHASGNDNNACDNLSSPSNSADISCPLHPLHDTNKNKFWVSKIVHLKKRIRLFVKPGEAFLVFKFFVVYLSYVLFQFIISLQ